MTKTKEVFNPEIAEAIADFIVSKIYDEDMSDDAARACLVTAHFFRDEAFSAGGRYAVLRDIPNDRIMGAMIRGYEAEKSRDEKLLAYYKRYSDRERYPDSVALSVDMAMKGTLEILGIKVGGINA